MTQGVVDRLNAEQMRQGRKRTSTACQAQGDLVFETGSLIVLSLKILDSISLRPVVIELYSPVRFVIIMRTAARLRRYFALASSGLVVRSSLNVFGDSFIITF